jgi:16S rRNA C967 or C1407 C5-methylase (RsmB/RsmF family)
MRGWNERVSENADWEMYYSAQKICNDEVEISLMKKSFQTPLPVSIRINNSASTHGSVKQHVEKLSQLVESCPNKCERLNWSVDGNAWQWNDVSRVHVRKDPTLVQLKKWFVDHESIGTLTRQEAVSMVPPIILGVKPGDLVLDMCAAPGSKTCQMIESLQSEGVVVANDVEWKRANMLAHQVQRLSSPANVVCNIDATHFPSIAGFDKILCDVPCTGDGTIRKAVDIWRRWSLADANAIHLRQLQILVRGINLLKPGGALVYSTCSLNPIENEAVVAAALLQFKGQVKLEGLEDLPGLKYREGLCSWKVFNDKTKTEVSREEMLEMEKQGKAGRLRSSMFAPEDEAITSQLRLTARFLPHLMNTGGFFVAKLVKHCDDSSRENKLVTVDKPHAELIPVDVALYESLTSFYGLEKTSVPIDQLYFRDAQKRHIYFVSEAAKRVLQSIPTSFKLVSIGVRAFAEIGKWESPCSYRLTQEGAEAFASKVTDRTRHGELEKDLFIELLEKREMKTDRIPAFEGIARGGGSVAMKASRDLFGGTVSVAVMVSPFSVHVYTEKLYCEYLLNILKNVHDPNRL